MAVEFIWNAGKARLNLLKHGVSFEEAVTVLNDTWSITISDPLHSGNEDRFVDIGTSYRSRVLVVVYCERGDTIRIISARKANRHERLQYEEGN